MPDDNPGFLQRPVGSLRQHYLDQVSGCISAGIRHAKPHPNQGGGLYSSFTGKASTGKASRTSDCVSRRLMPGTCASRTGGELAFYFCVQEDIDGGQDLMTFQNTRREAWGRGLVQGL